LDTRAKRRRLWPEVLQGRFRHWRRDSLAGDFSSPSASPLVAHHIGETTPLRSVFIFPRITASHPLRRQCAPDCIRRWGQPGRAPSVSAFPASNTEEEIDAAVQPRPGDRGAKMRREKS
jgi:hypothetical protein